MKKHICIFVALVMLIVSLAGCSRNMDYVIENEPHFAGKVEEITEDYVIVAVNNDESIFNDYPTVHASLNVEQADSYMGFGIGDEIVVYYDGNIAGEDPAKAEKVYAITMRTPESRETE